MIIRADARHLPLVDGCVQCVVTSPPYFGLRDYGTARWEGGDINCDHQYAKGGRNPETASKQLTNAGTLFSQYEHECKKCGAARIDAQIGLEPTPDAYVAALVQVFREVRRVMRDDGTVWLNLGDSYAGSWGARGRGDGTNASRPDLERKYGTDAPNRSVDGLKGKDLIGIPWRVAFALQTDGWYLRSDIIWAKPNPMPESVTDRPTKAHEYLFLLAKSERYYYDAAAIAEESSGLTGGRFGTGGPEVGRLRQDAARERPEDTGTRNKRTVWTIPTMPYRGAHFATMPEKLVEPCILAGCPLGGIVFDPFLGSGTVGAVAERLGRRWVGTDLTYQQLSRKRTMQRSLISFCPEAFE